MLQEPGALANWIYDVSGLEGVRFEPPVVSDITSLYERVQTDLISVEEESAIVDVQYREQQNLFLHLKRS